MAWSSIATWWIRCAIAATPECSASAPKMRRVCPKARSISSPCSTSSSTWIIPAPSSAAFAAGFPREACSRSKLPTSTVSTRASSGKRTGAATTFLGIGICLRPPRSAGCSRTAVWRLSPQPFKPATRSGCIRCTTPCASGVARGLAPGNGSIRPEACSASLDLLLLICSVENWDGKLQQCWSSREGPNCSFCSGSRGNKLPGSPPLIRSAARSADPLALRAAPERSTPAARWPPGTRLSLPAPRGPCC